MENKTMIFNYSYTVLFLNFHIVKNDFPQGKINFNFRLFILLNSYQLPSLLIVPSKCFREMQGHKNANKICYI